MIDYCECRTGRRWLPDVCYKSVQHAEWMPKDFLQYEKNTHKQKANHKHGSCTHHGVRAILFLYASLFLSTSTMPRCVSRKKTLDVPALFLPRPQDETTDQARGRSFHHISSREEQVATTHHTQTHSNT